MTETNPHSPADRAVAADKFRGSKEYLRVYSHLIDTAERQSTTGYKNIADIMGLPESGHYMAQQTGQMLGEISKHEHEYGRPLLSVLVVQAESGRPGPGFYQLAKLVGLLDAEASSGQERHFAELERDRVYDTWRR